LERIGPSAPIRLFLDTPRRLALSREFLARRRALSREFLARACILAQRFWRDGVHSPSKRARGMERRRAVPRFRLNYCSINRRLGTRARR
jgi:hypothetical protein